MFQRNLLHEHQDCSQSSAHFPEADDAHPERRVPTFTSAAATTTPTRTELNPGSNPVIISHALTSEPFSVNPDRPIQTNPYMQQRLQPSVSVCLHEIVFVCVYNA